MTSYTEEEIRKAVREYGWSDAGNRIIVKMDAIRERENHVHDFADTDTVTVKELREAFARLLPPGSKMIYVASEGVVKNFLSDIREHREFASENFKENSVVQDPEGNIWNLKGNRWGFFGYSDTVSYRTPRRPLKLLGVDARRS